MINTTGQLGVALGLGLSSLAFFSVVDGAAPAQAAGPVFVDAFTHALWWVAAGLLAVFALVFALPGRAARPVAVTPEPAAEPALAG
ncbi:hypothetical protein [Kitasatospora sp. HPMI-4]|uniref:hypothetical protein n=1 Tax=Kitasatospora sp. HPMI-4 TaxID=3448443 RepID=UPI003F1D6B48